MSKRNKDKRKQNREEFLLGYVIINRPKGVLACASTCAGSAAIVFGQREVAEHYRVEFMSSQPMVVEPAYLGHILHCLLCGGLYALDASAVAVWNQKTQENPEPFTMFAEELPLLEVPLPGRFKLLGFQASPVVQHAARSIMAEQHKAALQAN